MNLFDIRGKVVIVTGGTGFLGSKYCRYLKGQGAKVISWDLPKVDITSTKSIYVGIDDLQEPIQALINNAAIDFPPKKSAVGFGKVWAVNVEAQIKCIETIGSLMLKWGGGSIVNIGSIYGMVAPDQNIYEDGFIKPYSYGITKSALLAATKYFGSLWANKGVRVNTLTLGGVKNNQGEGFIKNYSAKVPMGRMADPDDYFGALHFLVSDASKYMTGANLVVDGGYTIL